MAKFRRTKTRIGDSEIDYSEIPEWCEGYEFESNDFNGIKEIGATYVRDMSSGWIHSWDSVEMIKT